MVKALAGGAMARVPFRSQADLEARVDRALHSEVRAEPASVEACGPPRIVHRCDGFVVIDKPPDVRLDGDFPVTVETLLPHWDSALIGAPLKWVHQLDFATSGLLCVGLTREAAHAASEAFKRRTVDKEYLAVVSGRVDCNGLPVRTALRPHREAPHRSGRKRKGVVYRPPSAFFFSEQAKVRRLVKAAAPGGADESEHDRAARVLDEDQRWLLHASWKDVKRDVEAKRRFVEASEEDRRAAEAKRDTKAQAELDEWAAAGPEAEADAAADAGEADATSTVAYRLVGEPEGCFYVDAPITNVTGDFRMCIAETDDPQGKPSRTRVQVDSFGTFNGLPVTKCRLTPLTGRRHQLRLHMHLLGHPIVGDGTYTPAAEREHGELAPRMMLHARRLKLTFDDGRPPLAAEAPDPFPLSSDGTLEPVIVAAPTPPPSEVAAAGKVGRGR